jgi:diacylglycerol O-acyltransferase / wax synthase
MERMKALDATFLAVEDAVNHMHIGSIGVFEGPVPDFADLCAGVASKLALVPRYRQKVRMAPANVGRPVWVDDPYFRLDYHLRHTALPRPGDSRALCKLVGRVMSQQLDRHKPLWETWIVEGLEDGSWAALTKMHHCMVDGVAGTDLLALVLDTSPEQPRPVVVAESWQPGAEPGALQLAAHSLGGLAGAPVRMLRAVAGGLRRPTATATSAVRAGRGLRPLADLLTPAPTSALTGPIGPHRRWDFCRVSLDDVRHVRTALGGTVNDVVLALTTQGLRALLLAAENVPPDRSVRTLVPVSVREPNARGVFDNRVSAMFAALPVGVDDAVEVLRRVRAQLDTLKGSDEVTTGQAVVGLVGFSLPVVHALGARLLVHRQHMVETVATNVPGPQFPLFWAGRRMIAAYPYVPLAGQVRVGVAIWSYLGVLHFGVTGDDDAVPDLHLVCAGIEDGLRELLKAASGRESARETNSGQRSRSNDSARRPGSRASCDERSS